MHGGLELGRPRRHSRWLRVAAIVLAVVGLWAAMPYLLAALPAGLSRCRETIGNWVLPHYTDELTALEQQNAALHRQLARAEDAIAENEAMRKLLGCSLPEGNWQPARVAARRSDRVTLACTAREGADVLDARGRYAGQVVEEFADGTCVFSYAGSDDAACAGLCGTAAGMLERQGQWLLTGLPADCGLAAGSVVTTPGGCWLGTLAEAPRPEADGLTARAALTDTADLNSTVFFVKIE